MNSNSKSTTALWVLAGTAEPAPCSIPAASTSSQHCTPPRPTASCQKQMFGGKLLSFEIYILKTLTHIPECSVFIKNKSVLLPTYCQLCHSVATDYRDQTQELTKHQPRTRKIKHYEDSQKMTDMQFPAHALGEFTLYQT